MRRSPKKRYSLANVPRKCGVVPWVQRGLLNHNLSHPPVTCCGRLLAAGGGSKLRLQHVAWMHIWFPVQGCGSAQRLSFVLCYDRLILKCGISTVCWATPGGSRPHGHSHIWLSSSSYSSSFYRICYLSLLTSYHFQSNPFNSQKHVCPPTSLMGPSICNIDIYCGLKWVLQVVAEHSDVGQ